MNEKDLPQLFGVDEINFSCCFSAPSLKLFGLLIVGWVLTVGKHTISRVILTMDLHVSRHFSSVYRFIAEGRWSADQVSSFLFRMLVRGFVESGVEIEVILDDTLYVKSGRKICGRGWQHDGSQPKGSKRRSYGVCFVVIGLAVRLEGINDRVFCLPFAARMWWPVRAKVKPKSGLYKKKTELGGELIELTESWLEEGESLRVIGDIAYTCRTIIRGISKRVHITGRARMDSAIHHLPECPIPRPQGRPHSKGPRMPTPTAMCQDPKLEWSATEVHVYGKKVAVEFHQFFGVWPYVGGKEIFLFVLCRDPKGAYPDALFVDTDCSVTPEAVIERYASRWSIEMTFRETKQHLGAGDPQCRREGSVVRTPMFAYWAYCIVVLWFVRHYSKTRRIFIVKRPWYSHKTQITFSDMLALARRSHFMIRFSTESLSNSGSLEINETRFTRHPKYTECAKL
jgi:hypothetical protein